MQYGLDNHIDNRRKPSDNQAVFFDANLKTKNLDQKQQFIFRLFRWFGLLSSVIMFISDLMSRVHCTTGFDRCIKIIHYIKADSVFLFDNFSTYTTTEMKEIFKSFLMCLVEETLLFFFVFSLCSLYVNEQQKI